MARRSFVRRSGLRDARLIVLACEGVNTERAYFEELIAALVPVPSRDDELWAVIDYDRWGEMKLSKVAMLATHKRYHLPVSRPCFEFWLLLHHRDPAGLSPLENTAIEGEGCSAVEALLRSAAGSYSKNLSNAAAYLPLVDAAVKRAESRDSNPDSRWPESPGSRVYKTVRSIRKPPQEPQ